MTTDKGPIHATAVACFDTGQWRGVLLTGPSGAGKSDMALRLIGRGWRLVADDYCHVWASGAGLFATAPATIAGKIEARGLGILSKPPRVLTRVIAVIDCVGETVERLPKSAITALCGVTLPHHQIDIRVPSSVELVIATIVAL